MWSLLCEVCRLIRKLSTALTKFYLVLDKVRGDIMERFQRRCDVNPKVMDEWERDDEGIEHLVECNNKKKEKPRVE